MKINITNHLLFKESNSWSLLNSCLDITCEAIVALNDEVRFHCAELPHSSFDIDALRHQINQLPNTGLLSRFLSGQEFADHVPISDALLPYRKVTNSGALLAALALSKDIIASDLPYFQKARGKKAETGSSSVNGNSIHGNYSGIPN